MSSLWLSAALFGLLLILIAVAFQWGRGSKSNDISEGGLNRAKEANRVHGADLDDKWLHPRD